MTAREKLAMEHPGDNIDKLCHDTCPEDYGYLGRFDRCPKDCYEWNAAVVCPKCWNREVKDCTTCSYADVPIDETPCNECDGVNMFQSKNTINCGVSEEALDKFNAVGNVQPIFPNEFKEGVRKQMYSLFMKEMTTNGTRYKLLEEKKDLATISERVKRMVISGTPIDDLCIVKNVEFEFKCVLEFKEDE